MRKFIKKLFKTDVASKKIIVELGLVVVAIVLAFVYRGEVAKTEKQTMAKTEDVVTKMFDLGYVPDLDMPEYDGGSGGGSGGNIGDDSSDNNGEGDEIVTSGIQFGKKYIDLNSIMGFVCYEDGSAELYYYGELAETIPAGYLKYETNDDKTTSILFLSEEPGEYVDDGSYATADGKQIILTGVEPLYLEGTYEYKERDFAIYSADDNSLSFYNSADILEIGDIYNGKTITAIYRSINSFGSTVPWEKYITSIKSVHVVDKISPTNTAYWFDGFENCTTLDLKNLDTSNVTDMYGMFWECGYNASEFKLDLSGWDTSKVERMNYMFFGAGHNAKTFDLNLSGWNTSNVKEMNSMFRRAGYKSTSFNITGLTNFNVSNVTDVEYMFEETGYSADLLELNLSDWKLINVTKTSYMFDSAGEEAKEVQLNLSNWDTSNITNMRAMFQTTGENASTFSLNLSNWNTSKVTDMGFMFNYAGESATNFNINGLLNWNTSNVEDMEHMFCCFGKAATYSLNLSNWIADKVTNYATFNFGVESKITPPTWVN